jgi:hypothetical protein
LLTVHLYVGIVVVALALLAVWWRTGRRITLYVVTLQILLGIVLMLQSLRVPWYHYALGIVGWAGYMVANAMARRSTSRTTVIAVTAISSVLLLIAFGIGHGAVQHGYAGP